MVTRTAAILVAMLIGATEVRPEGIWEPVTPPTAQDSAANSTIAGLNRLKNSFIMMSYRARQQRKIQGVAQITAGLGLLAVTGQTSDSERTWLAIAGVAMAASGVVNSAWPVTPQEKLWREWRALPEENDALKLTKLNKGKGRFAEEAKNARRNRILGGWATIAAAPLMFVISDDRGRGMLGAGVSLGVGVWRLMSPTEIENSWKRYRWESAGLIR